MPAGAASPPVCWKNTVAALGVPPAQLLAWIGPGISASHFEVGAEVRRALVGAAGVAATQAVGAFVPNIPQTLAM